ncbi:MAG: DUF126 domain-containing protein [Candidatus Micrarchaeia archaeon]|jgi:hypothetical protein
MQIKARSISRGIGEGEALVSADAISFFGGVDPKTGIVIDKGHALEGKCIAGKVLVFPRGKGSTVGSYVLLQLKKNNCAPVAIINEEAEPIIAVGAIIARIPMVDKLENGAYAKIKGGMRVRVDGTKGNAEIV